MTDVPDVSVWHPGGGQWSKVAHITEYTSLTVQPRHNDAGPWTMTMPYDNQAVKIWKDSLLTFDWRGRRIMTGAVGVLNPHSADDSGQPELTVSGADAFSWYGRAILYPDPTLPVAAQPQSGSYSGTAEDVLLRIITDHHVNRYGMNIVVPGSVGRGSSVTALVQFDNGLTMLQTKANLGGLGLNLGLIDSSGTRADLTASVYVPADKSLRVRLSQKVGNLAQWGQTDTEPTATSAVVGGAGDSTSRVYQVVTTADSSAAGALWGGDREIFVDGPASFDAPDLLQAGQEALTSGAATTNMAVTAAEASGLLAFRDYEVGDKATADLLDGTSIVDVITAIEVKVDPSGLTVTPAFGDPDAGAPTVKLAQLLRAIRRELDQVQRTRPAPVAT